MKRTLTKWMGLLALASVAGWLATGCAWQIGGDKHGTASVRATRGQELIDLKHARDQGAITEEQYQAQRKKILDQ